MTPNWNSAIIAVVIGASGLVTRNFFQVDIEDDHLVCYCERCKDGFFDDSTEVISKAEVSRVYANLNINGHSQSIEIWANPDYKK